MNIIDLNNKGLFQKLVERATTSKRNQFEEMVYSVLGESSLSRIMSQRSSHDTGCITAFRYKIPEERARKLNAKLNQILQNKGYGTTFVDGYYQEQEMEKASKEQSIFVVDLKDDGKLKQTLIALGTQFGQESILFKPAGQSAYLIRTSQRANGKESERSTATTWGKRDGAAWTEIKNRPFGDKINTPSSYWSDEDEEEDYLDIVSGDLYEWLMEVGSNSLLDDFKPHQLKNVIKMKLKKEKFIPNDDTEMANWCRKNEDDIIETVARATGAYFMSREDFLKKQQEEEEMPQVVVKGSEILYNKRGRACGIKVSIIDYGTLYMKRKGSHWEITDISKENDDERVWEMVKSSLEKMAKKNPTTFIRLMRNRAYELPKFKPTTITEAVTLNGIDVTLQDLKRRMVNAPDTIINDWLNKNDGWDFDNFKDIYTSIEDDTNPQQRLSNATNQIIAVVHEWLNLTEQNPQVSEIIRKNLKNYVMQTKNIPTTNKGIRKFVDTIWADQLLPFKQEKVEEIL